MARHRRSAVAATTRPRPREWLQFISLTAARWVLAVVGALLLWAVVPALFGWQTATVMTGSMEPHLPVGSLIVAAPPTEETLRPGAVLLMDYPGRTGELLSHRMVEFAGGGVVTKGDANPTADSAVVAPDAVHGVVRLVVPLIGHVAPWWHAGAYWHLAALGGFLALALGVVVADGLRARADRPGGRHRRATVRGWAAVVAAMAVLAGTLAVAPANAAFAARTTNPNDSWATTSSFVHARDSFGRTVASGLGTADVGGPWTATTNIGRQSVDGSTGVFRLTSSGDTAGSHLSGTTRADLDTVARIWLTDVPSGTTSSGGVSAYVVSRRTSAGDEYRTRVRLYRDSGGNSRVGVSLVRVLGGTETTLGSEVLVPSYSYTYGDSSTATRLNIHMNVSGRDGTNLEASVWPDGRSEPASPMVTATDSSAALQGAGGVGLSSRLHASSSEMEIHVGDLVVREGAP